MILIKYILKIRFLSVLTLSFFLTYFSFVRAQEVIPILNKSFEGVPRQGEEFLLLNHWTDCGKELFTSESAPDIHPGNFWKLKLDPSNGKTFVGMVVRDNDSWESISQRLQKPIVKGKCYKFSIDIARSDQYISKSQIKK